MEKAIVVENLSKTYKLYEKPQYRIKELIDLKRRSFHEDYQALNNVSFTVNKGETLGIIGCNGAGKSTLLKLITGVITPTYGSVQTSGQISALLELGTGFNPEYNGYENIYLNGSMRGLSDEEISEKLDEIIAFADIGEYMNQPVKMYSSGMFARLAFSVMVNFKPDILIIDEALSVGDVFFQQKCNAYMKEKMSGVTKLLVTHDMNSIANMADRVLLIDKGRIIKEGQPLDVIEDYLKYMHTQLFAKKDSAPLENMNSSPMMETIEKPYEDSNWITVHEDNVGGANEVRIMRCQMGVNGDFLTDVVKYNDCIEIRLVFHSLKKCGNLIIGYTFKDKYGNNIFAQNTLGENIPIDNVIKDRTYFVSFEFKWPEIIEGDYFLTLGIGEGEDQMVHNIQCWAHNVIHVESIALKPMHGIINHRIEQFSITSLK